MLLLHGAVDDNVHVANAFALMDRLHQEQHPFDSMIYPNVGHGLTGMALAGCGTFFWGTVSINRFSRVFPEKDLPGGDFTGIFSHHGEQIDGSITHRLPSPTKRIRTMATRKKTAKKRQENHRSQDHQEGRSKEGRRFEREAYCWLSDRRTKSQITNSIVDATGMSRKEANTV